MYLKVNLTKQFKEEVTIYATDAEDFTSTVSEVITGKISFSLDEIGFAQNVPHQKDYCLIANNPNRAILFKDKKTPYCILCFLFENLTKVIVIDQKKTHKVVRLRVCYKHNQLSVLYEERHPFLKIDKSHF